MLLPLIALAPELAGVAPEALEEAVQDHRYAPYVARQQSEIERLRADEAVRLPLDLDYARGRRAFRTRWSSDWPSRAPDARRRRPNPRAHAGGSGGDPGSRPAQGGLMDEGDARAWVERRFDVPRETMERLDAFAALLRDESERQNLVSKACLDQLWLRHIADSAQLLAFAPSPEAKLGGSGHAAPAFPA